MGRYYTEVSLHTEDHDTIGASFESRAMSDDEIADAIEHEKKYAEACKGEYERLYKKVFASVLADEEDMDDALDHAMEDWSSMRQMTDRDLRDLDPRCAASDILDLLDAADGITEHTGRWLDADTEQDVRRGVAPYGIGAEFVPMDERG